MLSFMVYYLLKNPEALRKLRAEVDTVLGSRPAQVEDFSKMPYLNGWLYPVTVWPDLTSL